MNRSRFCLSLLRQIKQQWKWISCTMKGCSNFLYWGFHIPLCWFALNLSIMFKWAHFKYRCSHRAIFSYYNGCSLIEILASGIAACSIQLLLWQVSPLQLSSSPLSVTTPPPQQSQFSVSALGLKMAIHMYCSCINFISLSIFRKTWK